MHHHDATVRVRYKETDQMGWVYHTNYLVYFEVGRTELLRTLGCRYRDLEADGYLLAVVDCAAKFHKAAQYDDELTIRAKLADASKASMRIEYEILRDGELLVTGHTTHAILTRKDLRPARAPKRLTDALARVTARG